MNPRFSHVRIFWKWYVLFLLAVVSIMLWVRVLSTHEGVLTFVALDVGQGDALFIESPTGVQIVIDGGPNNFLSRELSAVLPWYDRHVDMIIITNPDRDHYEGFFSFLDKYTTDVLVKSATDQDNELYKQLEEKIDSKKIPTIVGVRGQVIDLGGGAYIQILFPDRDVPGLSSNDGSLVMRLVYGKTSVMLQGDSTAKIESYLLSLDGVNLDSDILKTGHHGSRTSSGEEYVKAITPEWAIISAGKDNSYGHPHKEVVDTLNRYKVETLGTYDLGRIVFESDGENFVQK
ncbi:MAG: MBL fold metallo-hydrolase [Patescibacteria group bacterium]